MQIPSRADWGEIDKNDLEMERALVSAAEHVARRQEFYDSDPSIYDKFVDLYAKIQGEIEAGSTSTKL